MRKAQKERRSKALQIALLFGVIVVLLIGLSLLVKLGLLIHQSHFDAQHQFIIQVNQTSSASNIVIFSPDTHTIAILALTGRDAGTSAVRTIQLPVDAIVTSDLSGEKGSSLIHRVLIASAGRSTLNILDKLKLLAFSQTVSDDQLATKTLSLPTSQAAIDAATSSIAIDQTLYKDGMTIAIVNGSGVAGLGNTVAKILGHIGANVISVTTADKDVSTSSLVYTGSKTYTVNRLAHIFRILPVSTTKAGIADMTLTIGKDKTTAFSAE